MSTTKRQLSIAVQINEGTNTSPDITDISALFLSGETSLGTKQDNGSLSLTLTSLPGEAVEGVDVLLYAGFNGSTDVLFYGEIVDVGWNLDGTVTLACQDRLARLRHPWTREVRNYAFVEIVDEDTDTSTVQNLVEASRVEVTLTHIEGEGFPLGVLKEVLLNKGDIALDLIRRINEATVPPYDIYSAPNGGIWRTPRQTGSSDGSVSQGSNLYTAGRTRTKSTIVNSVIVNGLNYYEIPARYITQADSDYIPDPPKYIGREINNELIETGPEVEEGGDGTTRAEMVGDAWLALLNKRGDSLDLTIRGNGSWRPGQTCTVTSSRLGVSSVALYVTGVRHRVAAATFETTLTVEVV